MRVRHRATQRPFRQDEYSVLLIEILISAARIMISPFFNLAENRPALSFVKKGF